MGRNGVISAREREIIYQFPIKVKCKGKCEITQVRKICENCTNVMPILLFITYAILHEKIGFYLEIACKTMNTCLSRGVSDVRGEHSKSGVSGLAALSLRLYCVGNVPLAGPAPRVKVKYSFFSRFLHKIRCFPAKERV